VEPVSPVFDGNAVAMVIAPDSEVWVIASSVHAAFGFNPSSAAWDRTVPLPVNPGLFSHLAFSHATGIVVNGVTAGHKSALVLVDSATDRTPLFITSIRSYAA